MIKVLNGPGGRSTAAAYFSYRWRPVPEVLSSSERFYPGKLPALLGTFLDGGEIGEPFELWS